MKTVYITKETYEDNLIKVNFFEENATREVIKPVLNKKTGSMSIVKVNENYNKLLYCEKFTWIEVESEIDERVEQIRQEWETRINS